MATRQAAIGPYQAMAEDIENRKTVEASRRSPAMREPVTRAVTPLSPEGAFRSAPKVGPLAGPAASMGGALAASVRPSVSAPRPTVAAQPVVSGAAVGRSSPVSEDWSSQQNVMVPLTDRATRDVNPALAAAPKARAIVPQRAVSDVNAAIEAQPAMPVGRDVYGNVQWTPAMTSPAALRLQQRMNAANEARSLGFQPGSARAMQLQSQWDEAARAAFTGAMTPQQQAAYEREQAAERMRQGAAFRETPQYQMGEQAGRTAMGVAGEQARGLIGASATKAEQERLNREATAENERVRQAGDTGRTAMTTGELREGRKEVAEERRATADEQRKAREASAIGDQIAKLYASFEKVPEGTPAAKSLADRIAKLEAQHDKMLGIVQQGSEGAQSNAQRIAMLQERLAQYPNDPKAPAARAELKRLQALK